MRIWRTSIECPLHGRKRKPYPINGKTGDRAEWAPDINDKAFLRRLRISPE
jgi:hypothetical protein